MGEKGDDGDTERGQPGKDEEVEEPGTLFGAYSVVSPDVRIMLKGKPISAPAAD